VKRIQAQKKCDDCENGVVYSPVWADFNEAVNSRMKHYGLTQIPTDSTIRSWGIAIPPNTVPEESECEVCGGTSWVNLWMPFDLFAKEIKGFIQISQEDEA
jgi:hypothetical protein